jgi:DNA-binding LacI/PurR family transcriptional regulator
MEAILADPDLPTAVLAANDYSAFGALAALDAAGLDVPGDISLTGYDGLSLSRIGRIDLTTVAQPAAELGQRAMELLLERIEGERTEAKHEVVPPRLIVGSTTGPPRHS